MRVLFWLPRLKTSSTKAKKNEKQKKLVEPNNFNSIFAAFKRVWSNYEVSSKTASLSLTE